MKTHINLFLAGLFILIMNTSTGYSQENKIDLQSPEVQKQVFYQIITDPQLMKNFMDQLKPNDMAMKMMMSDMMMKCDMDTSICKEMSAMMAKHDKILERLGKELDRKEDSKYTIQRVPKYKHK